MKPPPLWLWALIAFTENTGGDDNDEDDDDDDDDDDDEGEENPDDKLMIMRTKMKRSLISCWISIQRLPRVKFADSGIGS